MGIVVEEAAEAIGGTARILVQGTSIFFSLEGCPKLTRFIGEEDEDVVSSSLLYLKPPFRFARF